MTTATCSWRCFWDVRLRGAYTLIAAFIALLTILAWVPAAYADELPQPELTESMGAMVVDQAGNVLYEKNPQQEIAMASTTKVMTAMVALDQGHSLDEDIKLVDPDLGGNSQEADFAAGQHISFGELMQVMLVYSANDAAYNMAKYCGGSEKKFVELMNEKAKELGMEHTHFVNSHGLEADGHYSCAEDLVKMGRYALENYPLIAQTVEMAEVETTATDGPVTLYTTDRLLLEGFDGVRGIKTGAVDNCFSFLGAFGRGGVQLYTAVLGCTTNEGRFGDTVTLVNWAYDTYLNKRVANPGWPLRLQTSAFDLGRKSIVVAASPYTAKVWPTGGKLSFSTSMVRADRLLVDNEAYGWASWMQDDRSLGGPVYTTQPLSEAVSSWPTFALPLFTETSELGRLS